MVSCSVTEMKLNSRRQSLSGSGGSGPFVPRPFTPCVRIFGENREGGSDRDEALGAAHLY